MIVHGNSSVERAKERKGASADRQCSACVEVGTRRIVFDVAGRDHSAHGALELPATPTLSRPQKPRLVSVANETDFTSRKLRDV